MYDSVGLTYKSFEMNRKYDNYLVVNLLNYFFRFLIEKALVTTVCLLVKRET